LLLFLSLPHLIGVGLVSSSKSDAFHVLLLQCLKHTSNCSLEAKGRKRRSSPLWFSSALTHMCHGWIPNEASTCIFNVPIMADFKWPQIIYYFSHTDDISFFLLNPDGLSYFVDPKNATEMMFYEFKSKSLKVLQFEVGASGSCV
jgi:hypothetical protein